MTLYSQYHMGKPTIEDMHSRIRQKRAIDWLSASKRTKVLEIGSGVNPLLGYSGLPKGDFRLLTVEPDPSFARVWTGLFTRLGKDASGSYRLLNSEFEFVEESQVLDFFRGEPDAIVINSLLHEVLDELTFLQKIGSFAGTKTLLFVNVPNAESLHRQVFTLLGHSTGRGRSDEIRPQPRRSFTTESLSELVGGFGWRLEATSTVGLRFFTMAQMESIYDAGLHNLPSLDELLAIATSERWGSEIEAVYRRD